MAFPGGNQQPTWPGGTPAWPTPSGNGGWPQPAGFGSGSGASGPGAFGPGPGASGPGAFGPGPGVFGPGSGSGSGPGAFGPGAFGPGNTPQPGPVQPSPAQRNMVVPFKLDLKNLVFDKHLITIDGCVKPNADKITVDVFAGKDVALHVNPRFNENGSKVIVRNSKIGNKWGKEERDLPQGFPFTPGKNFQMKILFTRSCFKVSVDGKHRFDFKHRITNLNAINLLLIHNDLTLTNVYEERLP